MADTSDKKMTNLSPELLEKARVELNENPSEVTGHITALRERILEDPNKNFRTDDAFLLRFLRVRKFDQDNTLELMSNYYRQRENYPTLFNKTKSELERILDQQGLGVLPDRDSEGRAIFFLIAERWNPHEVSFEELMFQFYLTLEVLVEEEAFQINGSVLIFDLTGFSVSQAAQMTPWKLKEAITVLMDAFPMRVKGIHYVNETLIFDAVFQISRPFLSKKILDRVLFHGNCLASLHEYVSPEILPEELGGHLDFTDYSEWNERLLQSFDRITGDYEYGFIQK